MQSGYIRRILLGGVFCGIAATVVNGFAIGMVQFAYRLTQHDRANDLALAGLVFPLLVMVIGLRWTFPIGFLLGLLVAGWWQWGLDSGARARELTAQTSAIGAAVSLFVPFLLNATGWPGFVVGSGFVLCAVVGAITAALYGILIGARVARKISSTYSAIS